MAIKKRNQSPGMMVGIGLGIVIFICVIVFALIVNMDIYFPYAVAISYMIIMFPLLNIVIGLIYKFSGHYIAARVHLIMGSGLTAIMLIWWIYGVVMAL
ncbi:MAG: hypothetical protein ACI857_002719 [Arenicella sp.]|jgi:hypothetical protein